MDAVADFILYTVIHYFSLSFTSDNCHSPQVIILFIKITETQNEVAPSYHRVRRLYFMAVIYYMWQLYYYVQITVIHCKSLLSCTNRWHSTNNPNHAILLPFFSLTATQQLSCFQLRSLYLQTIWTMI